MHLLGSNRDLFKPQITSQIHHKHLNIDLETQDWLIELANERTDTASAASSTDNRCDDDDDDDSDEGDDGDGSDNGDIRRQPNTASLNTHRRGRNPLSPVDDTEVTQLRRSLTAETPTSAALDESESPRLMLSLHRTQSIPSNANRRRHGAWRVQEVDSADLADTLSRISRWEFDAFEAATRSKGRPLVLIGFALFRRHHLIEDLGLPVRELMNFLASVETGYRDNPYHNAIHAADVSQAVSYFMMNDAVLRHGLTPIEKLARDCRQPFARLQPSRTQQPVPDRDRRQARPPLQ